MPERLIAPDELKRSIDSLQRLYTIVVGLALTEALRSFLGLQVGAAAPPGAAWSSLPWPALITLVFTIVPFYHGANGHLDQTYLFSPPRIDKRPALIVDFLMLFLEGVVFLVLALSLTNAQRFGQTFIALLLIDIVWGIFVYFASVDRNAASPVKSWIALNVIAVAVLYVSQHTNLLNSEQARLTFLGGTAVVRTAVDYITCWDFYVARWPVNPGVERAG
jgi:hypothetical protein